MIVTVLGSSGSVPGPGNACSGYLVEHGGHRLLLDLGTGAFGTLLTYARPEQVDTVVVSHRHGDHSADLSALAYAQEKRAPRAEPTRVIAPAGTRARMGRTSPLAFEDARAGETRCGPFRLRLVPVRHSVETYAVRVEAGGGVLTYTGDSGPCHGLLDLARGSGLLLAEAALGHDDARDAAPGGWDGDATGPPPHHLTARQTGELASAAGVGLLAVTHLRPWEDAGRSLAAAAERFGGPVLLARPGLRLAPGRPARAPDPEEEK